MASRVIVHNFQSLAKRVVFSRGICHSYTLHTNFHHLYKTLKLSEIQDLPSEDIISLPVRHYKPSKGYEVDDKLPRIIMLHGLFGSKQNYRNVGKEICEKSQHITAGLDLRNHGEAEWAAPHTYLNLAQDVIHYLDNQELKDVILVGHSMGAKVAMIVSLLRSDLVSKLVVIDNSPAHQKLDTSFLEGLIGMCKVERKLKGSTLPSVAKLKKIDDMLAKYENDPLVRIFYMSNIVKKSKHGNLFRVPVLNFLKGKVLENLEGWPAEELIDKKFDKPVLVLKAKHSNFINDNTIPIFSTYFTQFELHEVDSGHWIVSEKPSTFVNLMLNFIRHSF